MGWVEWVEIGRVTVDREVVRDPARVKVNTPTDNVVANGKGLIGLEFRSEWSFQQFNTWYLVAHMWCTSTRFFVNFMFGGRHPAFIFSYQIGLFWSGLI